MYRALVACRTGMGSNLVLKTKMGQIIEEYGLLIKIEHTNLNGVPGFDGDKTFTLSDAAARLKAEYPRRYIARIQSIAGKASLLKEMQMFLKTKGDK